MPTIPSRQDGQDVRPCLFCRGNEAKTDEHVLQQAFETDLVLTDDVCDGCNRLRFSPLDTKLIEYVRRFARHRELDTHPTALLNSGHPMCFSAERGTWVSFRVDADGNGIPFPQVVFSDPADRVEERRQGTFIASQDADHRRLLGRFQAELSEPDRCSFSVRVVDQPSGEPAVQPAVIRSARRAYVVRARTGAS